MKNKGFTLIELLAVIVILSIIAIITVPMIMNVIDKAKLGALEDSAYGLIESANLYYSENISTMADKITFDFENGKQTSKNQLKYKGNIEHGKLILNTDGKVVVCIDNGANYSYKNLNETKVTSGKGKCSFTGDTGDFNIVSDTDTLNQQVTELQNELSTLKLKGDANPSDILEGKTAVVKGELITGANKGYEAGYNDGKKLGTISFELYGNHTGGTYTPVTYARVQKLNVSNFSTITLSSLGQSNGKNCTYKVINLANNAVILNGTGSADISSVDNIDIQFQATRSNTDSTYATVWGTVTLN